MNVKDFLPRRKTIDLKQLYKEAKAGATEIFAKQGSLLQVALAITADGDFLVMACPWGDADERSETLQTIRVIFEAKRVRAYAFVAECWITTQEPGDPFVQPRLSDRRKECVTVSASDGVTKIMGLGEIVRPFSGPATLGPIKEMNGGLAGDLLSLLDA